MSQKYVWFGKPSVLIGVIFSLHKFIALFSQSPVPLLGLETVCYTCFWGKDIPLSLRRVNQRHSRRSLMGNTMQRLSNVLLSSNWMSRKSRTWKPSSPKRSKNSAASILSSIMLATYVFLSLKIMWINNCYLISFSSDCAFRSGGFSSWRCARAIRSHVLGTRLYFYRGKRHTCTETNVKMLTMSPRPFVFSARSILQAQVAIFSTSAVLEDILPSPLSPFIMPPSLVCTRYIFLTCLIRFFILFFPPPSVGRIHRIAQEGNDSRVEHSSHYHRTRRLQHQMAWWKYDHSTSPPSLWYR